MSNIIGLGTVTDIVKDNVKVIVDSIGAKVLAIEVDDHNVLFYDKEDIKHSGIPICLPYFGPLRGGCFEVEGSSYEMGQHGFFRDSEFDVVVEGDSIICTLSESEESLKKYPYNFTFTAKYTVVENGLSMKFILENRDTKEMAIAPGFHPYFKVDNPDEIYFQTQAVDGNDSLQDFKTVGLTESGVFEITKEEEGVKTIHVVNAPDMHLLNHGLNKTIITPGTLPKIALEADMAVLNRMTIWRDNPSSSSICVEPAYEENALNKRTAITIPAGSSFDTTIAITTA